jgi:hypothetical protein
MDTAPDIESEEDMRPSVRSGRRVQLSVALSLLGLTMITLGLAIDFVLHANDPNLAAVEGLFTIGNPGHVLLGLGIAATSVGLGLAAWSMVSGGVGESKILRLSGFAAALGVFVLVGAVAYIAAGPGFGHDHGDSGAQALDDMSEHDHSTSGDEQADQSRVPRDEGIALAMLSWTRSSSLAEGDAHEHAGADIGIDDLTPDEREQLSDQFASASAVVEEYMDVEQALAAGYSQTSPRVDGVGYHYTKWSLVDEPFDLAQPSQLLYDEVTFGEGLELVALSYWAASDSPPVGFAGEADAWHQHFGTCFVNGYLVDEGVPDRDSCAGDWVNGSDLWMIHAWIVPGMENEVGVFSAANPRICERICAAEN